MEVKAELCRPYIFEYENYRIFLKDYVSYSKQKNPQFSYRYIAQKAGFTSPNFLKLVINGTRNLSQQSILQFAKAFKFSISETEFFEYLVHFSQSDSETQKAQWAQKILSCKGLQKIHPLRQAEYAYYANWYYIPLREMISLNNFKEDSLWIAQQFNPALIASQIEHAIEDLLKIGLIIRDSRGRLVQTQKTVSTGNEVSHSLVKQYHKDMIQRGSDSIENTPKLLRDISATCIPVSASAREEIKIKIQQFRKEILAIAETSDIVDEIYQLNIQWFPLLATNKGTT